MQPITKLDKLDDLLDAAVVGFACAFIDFSAEDRKHLSAHWIHDLPARMTDMKTKLLSTEDGKALYTEWKHHFKDSRNYKVDLDNNYVLLQTFPKCSAVSIEVCYHIVDESTYLCWCCRQKRYWLTIRCPTGARFIQVCGAGTVCKPS